MGIKRDASLGAQKPEKKVKLTQSPKKVDHKEEAVIESSDEELSFEEPKPWNEVPWVNSDNEPMGLSIKGKAKLFKTSSLKIVSLMKRRMRVFNVNGVKIKVIKHSYKKGALCCDIEVGSKDDSKEIIEATLFQPKGTITIIRKPDVNPSYIYHYVMYLWDS